MFKLPFIYLMPDDDSGTPAPDNADAAPGDDVAKSDSDPKAEALAKVNEDLNEAENALYEKDGTAKKDEAKPEDGDDEGEKDDDDDKKEDEPIVSKNGVEKPEDLKTVPEDGNYYIEIPEDMEMDTKLLESMSGLWKEKGVTHAEAQELANKYVANLQDQYKDAEQQAFQQREDDVQKWTEETKADKEVGGDNLESSLQNVHKALKTFGNDELSELLETTGLGSNVKVIKFMSKVGAALGEDDIPDGDPAKLTSDKPIEQVLYGKTTG